MMFVIKKTEIIINILKVEKVITGMIMMIPQKKTINSNTGHISYI